MSESPMLNLLRTLTTVAPMQDRKSVCDRYGASYLELTGFTARLLKLDLGVWLCDSNTPMTLDWYAPFSISNEATKEEDRPDVTWFSCSLRDARSIQSETQTVLSPPDVLVVGEWRHDLDGEVAQYFVRERYLHSSLGKALGNALLKAKLSSQN